MPTSGGSRSWWATRDASEGDAETVEGAAGAYVDWLAAMSGEGVPAAWRSRSSCGNGAAHAVAPALTAGLGLDAQAIGVSPDGRNINDGVGSTHLDAVARLVGERGAVRRHRLRRRRRPLPRGGLARTDGERRRHRGGAGDRPAPARAARRGPGRRHLDDEYGLSQADAGVGDRTRGDRRRRPLCARSGDRHGATLGGEQSGHIVDLVHHTTGNGLAAAVLLLAALERLGMTLDDATELVCGSAEACCRRRRPFASDQPKAGMAEVDGQRRSWVRTATSVVRASGTEPVVRVMVEAADRVSARPSATTCPEWSAPRWGYNSRNVWDRRIRR